MFHYHAISTANIGGQSGRSGFVAENWHPAGYNAGYTSPFLAAVFIRGMNTRLTRYSAASSKINPAEGGWFDTETSGHGSW